MIQVFYILLATVFTFTASLSAGTALLRVLSAKLYRAEQYFFGFILGAACLSLAVFLLTAAGLAYRPVFLVLGIALLCCYRPVRGSAAPALPRFWLWVFALPYTVFAVVYLANALLPEASPDGLLYHVSMVARCYREHRLSSAATNLYAAHPEGIEMLFLFAYSFGKETAAAMVHFLFTLAAPLGMLSYARRIGRPMAGVSGSLLFFLSPVIGRDGTSAYNDVALACILFGVFYLLQIWREERLNSLLIPIGLLTGFAYTVKYTGGLAVPYAAAFVLFYSWRWRQPMLRPALVVTLCAVAVMTPWMLKNALFLDNPFAPLGNRFFPNPYYTVFSEQELARVLSHQLDVHWWQLPYQAAVTGRIDGLLGPVFLLAPFALAALWFPPGRQLLLAAVLFALPYGLDISTRFLIPALPFLSLAMALVLTRWRALGLLLVLATVLTSWPRVVRRYAAPGTWTLPRLDWRSALRLRPEADFLREHVRDYQIGLIIEKTVPPGQRIFAFSQIQQLYQTHEVIGGWQSAFGRRISEDLLAPYLDRLQPVWRHRFRFAAASTRAIRLVETQRTSIDRWSLNEVRIFRAGVELQRTPQWHYRARPNPWDVQLAFDNNPVTRWTSAEPFTPGMFVEVDFAKPELVDEVVVECAHDQEEMSMRLEGDAGPLAAVAERYDVTPPDSLRHAAVDALRQNGINWVLVDGSEMGADDLLAREGEWGITLAAQDGAFRLYRLH